MIIANLIGGLGNQLFQYACALALARRTGHALALAVDQFADYALHQGFELTRVFAAEAPLASPDQVARLLGPLQGAAARRWVARLLPGRRQGGRAWFEPADGRFLPALLQTPGPAYLHGYWQDERYFADQAVALRQQLRFREPSAQTTDGLRRLLDPAAGTPVSVHLRRGDYVSNPKNQRIYADCTPSYYAAAMDRLQAMEPRATFWVFSDDMPWAREVLADRRSQMVFVDHNRGPNSWNDLLLMSRCRYHIIANSTFSWWGAWLAERPGQVVISPRLWFNDAARGVHTVPQRWQRL